MPGRGDLPGVWRASWMRASKAAGVPSKPQAHGSGRIRQLRYTQATRHRQRAHRRHGLCAVEQRQTFLCGKSQWLEPARRNASRG